jgi:hypothetical protein
MAKQSLIYYKHELKLFKVQFFQYMFLLKVCARAHPKVENLSNHLNHYAHNSYFLTLYFMHSILEKYLIAKRSSFFL